MGEHQIPTAIGPVIFTAQGVGGVVFLVVMIWKLASTTFSGSWRRDVEETVRRHQKLRDSEGHARELPGLNVVEQQLDHWLPILDYLAEFYFTACGLIGTVLGLSYAFRLASKNIPPAQLQGLIGMAMRTTVVGLIAAVFALLMVALYRHWAKQFLLGLVFEDDDV